MAKKRVHEIAKERGISSKEVLAVLQQAGLDVKAAASSVDEQDIARAFASASDGSSNGADAATAEPAAPEDGDRAPGPKPPSLQPPTARTLPARANDTSRNGAGKEASNLPLTGSHTLTRSLSQEEMILLPSWDQATWRSWFW